ncbi:MAG: polysaccharide deacetylase family protein [Desulfuromonadales bacterium]|nr:polysaccharide deacetylase family protein [Desulfuromonadales bacterium]
MSKLMLKKFISRIAVGSGLLSLVSLRVKNKGLILMYHRILDSVQKEKYFIQPGMYVLAETFRSHVAFLKENYTLLSLPELMARTKNGQNINKCCAITFDDGWRDNYTHAFAVIKEYQVPATIFLATEFVGTNRLFWPEELTFFLQKFNEDSRPESDPLLSRLREKLRNQTSPPELFLDAAILELKSWRPEERHQLLVFLRDVCGTVQPERLFINWDEAREMLASGLVSFGAHTANHVLLDQVTLQEAETEVVASLQTIKDKLGAVPDFFAYPNGNYTNRLKSLLKQHGFKGAVTTKKGWVEKSSDFFAIPRVGMHQDVCSDLALFEARTLLRRF